VYSGSCPAAPSTAIACVDDACGTGGTRTRVEFFGVAGQAYTIRLGGYQSATGSGTLTIACASDTAGIALVESDGGTSAAEGGAGDEYTLVLAARPTAPVTITLGFDALQLSAAPDVLTFDDTNWSTPQPVAVSAVEDMLVEGAHAADITHTVASADARYDGFAVADVAVSIADNDSATRRGDSNCDGVVNFDDIDCFVGALISPAAWLDCGGGAGCDYVFANDINADTLVNFDDIDPFVACLILASCP
jgi:hypothetical protein